MALILDDVRVRKPRRRRVSLSLANLFIVLLGCFFLIVSDSFWESDELLAHKFLTKLKEHNKPTELIEVYSFILKNQIFSFETVFYNFIIVKLESNFRAKSVNRNIGSMDIGYSQINTRTYEYYKRDFLEFLILKLYSKNMDFVITIISELDNLFNPYVNILFSCYYIENVIYKKLEEKGLERKINYILSLYNSNRIYPKNPITKRYITRGEAFISTHPITVEFKKHLWD